MSEAFETWIDAGVGETREALVSRGRAVALRVARESDEGRRARWGEVYCARVREVDPRRRGAFLELGLSEGDGFLPLDAGGLARLRKNERVKLIGGQGVVVSVAREAARNKRPVLALMETGHDGEAAHRIARPECDLALAQAKPASGDVRANLDEAIEDALSRSAPIPGGGALCIEPTAALVAIDVDAGARAGSSDAERFALELNLAAAAEAARQVRLRNLGGLIAIDFVNMRNAGALRQLDAGVRAAFAGDPWGVQFGGMSRFGVYELSRAQLRTPLHEQLRGVDGRMSAESVALNALRAIEREARAQGGRQIACTIGAEVKAWLDSGVIDWRAELSGRIGMRWSLDANAAWPRDKIDVRAL